MLLEDYFDFHSPDDIRIKGHRIGIETILYEYLYRDLCPEEITIKYPTLTLEQVYATVLYYLHNPEIVGKYVSDWLEWSSQTRKAASENPSPSAIRIMKIRSEIESYPLEERESARERIIVREKAKNTYQTIRVESS